jgi:hypothetical protein
MREQVIALFDDLTFGPITSRPGSRDIYNEVEAEA